MQLLNSLLGLGRGPLRATLVGPLTRGQIQPVGHQLLEFAQYDIPPVFGVDDAMSHALAPPGSPSIISLIGHFRRDAGAQDAADDGVRRRYRRAEEGG